MGFLFGKKLRSPSPFRLINGIEILTFSLFRTSQPSGGWKLKLNPKTISVYNRVYPALNVTIRLLYGNYADFGLSLTVMSFLFI